MIHSTAGAAGTTQCDNILRHLLRTKNAKIDGLTALELYGCFRLASRICDLRRHGWSITTQRVQRNKKWFCEYSIDRNQENNARMYAAWQQQPRRQHGTR